MIRQWELLHTPSSVDPNRYRISLWSDGQDVDKIRSLFANRTGVVWVPHRKPYTAAFFLYHISSEEKKGLEQILSGDTLSFDLLEQFKQKNDRSNQPIPAEDKEILGFDAVAQDENDVSSGLGLSPQDDDDVRIGYLVPEYIPDAPNIVHETLIKTLRQKKVSVSFDIGFKMTYTLISLPIMQEFVMRCKKDNVRRVIAVGDPSNMKGLVKVAEANHIYVKTISESVIDPNLWLTTIAEILSFE